MEFSDRLKLVIKRSGLKREEFAEKTGKSRTQIFKYLGGEQNPTSDFFQAVKAAFPWVNVEWLLTGIGSMDTPVVSDPVPRYGGLVDRKTELILMMLAEMSEEQKEKVRVYAEDQKRLADLTAAAGGEKGKKRGAA